MEVWKNVHDYEGRYMVSSIGRVKSLARHVRDNTGTRLVSERILKHGWGPNGYWFVVLYKNCNKKIYRVHQLVAMSFLDHKPNGNTLVVDHINHNKRDNRVENLRIVTQRENTTHLKKHGASKYPGVCFFKRDKVWVSRIKINGVTKYLGRFDCETKASEAYQKELKKIS